MQTEYGLTHRGDAIDCDHGFIADMEEQLPKDRVIEVTKTDDGYKWCPNNWFISDDMIVKNTYEITSIK